MAAVVGERMASEPIFRLLDSGSSAGGRRRRRRRASCCNALSPKLTRTSTFKIVADVNATCDTILIDALVPFLLRLARATQRVLIDAALEFGVR
mmetsp:Transcript_26581/g.88582  ORF Transcript_26581/g.88582 Transcript_26581/m.88582 type:complete len:94 (-) Transcript_26581:425-706(-)